MGEIILKIDSVVFEFIHYEQPKNQIFSLYIISFSLYNNLKRDKAQVI